MIEYVFEGVDEEVNLNFKVDIDRANALERVPVEKRAPWTELSFHQCSVCPLNKDDVSHCPAAVDLQEILGEFAKILSYKQFKVTVKTEKKEFFKICDAQQGLQALLGLVMGSSGCPILRYFYGLTKFHVPFCSMDETIFRITGYFAVRQLIANDFDKETSVNLDELIEQYEKTNAVNEEFFNRINKLSVKDSNLNSIVAWASTTQMVVYAIQDILEGLRPAFVETASKD